MFEKHLEKKQIVSNKWLGLKLTVTTWLLVLVLVLVAKRVSEE
jgi:hypothetical protein